MVDIISSSAKLSQNSTGGSSTTSFMLQECTFPIAWFWMCRKCLSCSFSTILYPSLHLRSHFPGYLFLKYTLSPILKEGGCLSIFFCAVLKQFSSNVFPRWVCGLQDLVFQNLDLPKSIAWALKAHVGANSDLFHTLGRMVFLL